MTIANVTTKMYVQPERRGLFVQPKPSDSWRELMSLPFAEPAQFLLEKLRRRAAVGRYPLRATEREAGRRLRHYLSQAFGLDIVRCEPWSLANPGQDFQRRGSHPKIVNGFPSILNHLGPISVDCQAWRFYKCWEQLHRCHPKNQLFQTAIEHVGTILSYHLGYLEGGNTAAGRVTAQVLEQCFFCLPLDAPDADATLPVLFA